MSQSAQGRENREQVEEGPGELEEKGGKLRGEAGKREKGTRSEQLKLLEFSLAILGLLLRKPTVLNLETRYQFS